MNSKNRLVPALVVVAVAFCCGTAMAQFGGDANVWIGMKKFSDDLKLEEEDFLSIDLTQQTEYGLMLNLGQVDWPVAIAVDILRASDDGTDSYSYYYYAAEARVEVSALDKTSWERRTCCHGLVFMVAMSPDGEPLPVPA